jgi:hypothetical protein
MLILKIILFGLFGFFFIGCSQHNYFIEAGKRHHVNYKTLRAIAEVESHNYDYIVHLNYNHIFSGSHRFDGYLGANAYMDYVLDPTFANYNIGVCQINKIWLDIYDLDNEDLLDRETNIDIAARIYKQNLKRCKNNIYCALSLYNTGRKKSKIGRKYANRVLRARKKLFGN